MGIEFVYRNKFSEHNMLLTKTVCGCLSPVYEEK